MSFMKSLAQTGTFGLAGLALSKKKKQESQAPQPSMISSIPLERRPTSMIGPSRGGY